MLRAAASGKGKRGKVNVSSAANRVGQVPALQDLPSVAAGGKSGRRTDGAASGSDDEAGRRVQSTAPPKEDTAPSGADKGSTAKGGKVKYADKGSKHSIPGEDRDAAGSSAVDTEPAVGSLKQGGKSGRVESASTEPAAPAQAKVTVATVAPPRATKGPGAGIGGKSKSSGKSGKNDADANKEAIEPAGRKLFLEATTPEGRRLYSTT